MEYDLYGDINTLRKKR